MLFLCPRIFYPILTRSLQIEENWVRHCSLEVVDKSHQNWRGTQQSNSDNLDMETNLGKKGWQIVYKNWCATEGNRLHLLWKWITWLSNCMDDCWKVQNEHNNQTIEVFAWQQIEMIVVKLFLWRSQVFSQSFSHLERIAKVFGQCGECKTMIRRLQ